jgi:hypothetical protein
VSASSAGGEAVEKTISRRLRCMWQGVAPTEAL